MLEKIIKQKKEEVKTLVLPVEQPFEKRSFKERWQARIGLSG